MIKAQLVGHVMPLPGREKPFVAARNTVEIYDHLLSDAAVTPGKPSEAVARARQILVQGVDEVAGRSPHGGDPRSAAAADRYRLSILECLERLDQPSPR